MSRGDPEGQQTLVRWASVGPPVCDLVRTAFSLFNADLAATLLFSSSCPAVSRLSLFPGLVT